MTARVENAVIRAVLDVRETDGDMTRRHEAGSAIGPLDDHESLGGQDVVPPDRDELTRLAQPVKVSP